jgi:hypothetical protein
MIAFIDDHRAVYGVDPIYRQLPIAPSTYRLHAARRAVPSTAAHRDPPGVGRELPGLRRAQGLAAASP